MEEKDAYKGSEAEKSASIYQKTSMIKGGHFMESFIGFRILF